MKRLKALLKRVLFLPLWLTAVIAVPSYAFVFVMLARNEHSALSYLSYVLSAYALVITATAAARGIEAAQNGVAGLPLLAKLRSHPLGSRLLGDAVFRSEITLHGGLLVNLLYAGLNLIYGVRDRSAWFVALACYYLLLCAMRGLLVRYVHKSPLGWDLPAEYRRYRACGVLLLFMNGALAGVIGYMVHQDRGATYPGLMIYMAAAYTFYITIAAIVNVIRWRRRGSPILSAAKNISLTAALVSMLTLEHAMTTQFGGGRSFRRTMTAAFGGTICVAVLGMAVVMIVQAGRNLHKLQTAQKQR